jgi:Helicase HerA, central domain
MPFEWLDQLGGLWSRVFGANLVSDERQTQQLVATIRGLRSKSHFQTDEQVKDYIADILVEAAETVGVSIGHVVGEPLFRLVSSLLVREPFLYDPKDNAFASQSLAQGIKTRQYLKRVISVLQNETETLSAWRKTTMSMLVRLLEYFPAVSLADPRIDGTEETYSVLSGTAPLYTMIEDLPVLLQTLVYSFSIRPEVEKDLFWHVAETFDANVCAASGVPFVQRHTSTKQAVFPINNTKLTSEELVATYMTDTAFAPLLMVDVPIPISQSIRFEHTHILAGTGHGKTQTLQYLIADDLRRGCEVELSSVVVLDPHGDLIKTLERTEFFLPHLYGRRTIIIDPVILSFQ